MEGFDRPANALLAQPTHAHHNAPFQEGQACLDSRREQPQHKYHNRPSSTTENSIVFSRSPLNVQKLNGGQNGKDTQKFHLNSKVGRFPSKCHTKLECSIRYT